MFLMGINSISASDFEIGDLEYDILSSEDRTVEVSQARYFDNDLEIPSKVVHNSKTYTVIQIAKGGFKYSWFKKATLPETLISIGDEAFMSCHLTTIEIPNSVTHIGNLAFNGCYLNNINIPENLESVGKDAFNGLKMKNIVLPSSCTYIAQDAFSFSSLESITIENENYRYCTIDGILYIKGDDGLILYFCPKGMPKSVVVPESAYTIAKWAFEDCTLIPSINLPKSLQSIGKIEYSYNRNGSSFTLGTFGNCKSLKEITIPKSVQYIDMNAFAWCYDIKSIFLEWETPLTCANLGWEDDVIMNSILYVPNGTIELYKHNDSWMDFWNIEEYQTEAGIQDLIMDSTTKDAPIYDILGRKISNPIRGTIYIKNGEKYILR